MPVKGRQYESRLDRKLDVYGDLTRAQRRAMDYYGVVALFQAKSLQWWSDLMMAKEAETNEERLDRIRAALDGKSYGTSTKWGVRADVDVPIVRTAKPEVTVVLPRDRA